MPGETFNLTEDYVLEGYSTYELTLTVNDSVSGLPFNLSFADRIEAVFRDGTTSEPGSTVLLTVAYSATDPYPDSGIRILAPATAGNVHMVISAEDTKALQDADTTSGVWDIVAYTNATGSGNSEQKKLIKTSTWSLEKTSTQVTP